MSSYLFNNIADYRFRDLNTIARNNNIQNHTRIIPFQSYLHYNGREEQSLNSIRYIFRQGDEKYADVFPNKSRATNHYDYDGRRLFVQKSLEANKTKDLPEVKSQYKLKVVGTY
jgi:hypothetical protein